MRSVQVTRFGGPEVMVASESPDPAPGPGQTVVSVSAVHVLFVETQIRRGWGQEYFRVQPPYVPGDAVAGQVILVGEGVDHGWIGRRVAARTREGGGYADRALVSVEELIPVPDGLDLRKAAALLHDGPTALALFDNARIEPQEQVLVLGAAGGLGLLLVQLAHAASAQVIGAARGRRKLDVVQEAGADVAVDYAEPGWAEQVRKVIGDAGFDVVFDGVGGTVGAAAFGLTAPGGRFSAHGAPSGGFADIDAQAAQALGVTVRGIEQVQFAPAESKRLAERALSEAAAGRLRPVIGQTFPLERAAEAHAAMEARVVLGTTLLLPNG